MKKSKSSDRTGTGHMTYAARSHDHTSCMDMPPQYFVLDPEALADVDDQTVGIRDNRENNNEYT